jgi:hypothetical protein
MPALLNFSSRASEVDVRHAGVEAGLHDRQIEVVLHRVDHAARAGDQLHQRRVVGDVDGGRGHARTAERGGRLLRPLAVEIGDDQILDGAIGREVAPDRPADDSRSPQDHDAHDRRSLPRPSRAAPARFAVTAIRPC